MCYTVNKKEIIMEKNKNIFVTGGSRGIGKEIALNYARRGYDVYICGRDEIELGKVQSEIESLNQKCFYSACDVRNQEAAQLAVLKAVESMGSIDRAFLSAGIDLFDSVAELDLEIFKSVININVFGMIHYLKPLINYSLKTETACKIGVLSSLGDVRGIPGSTAYCSSKAAVSKILESARIELRDSPVEIITIRPGFVKTDMTAKNKFKMPFLMSSEKAAKIISVRVERGAQRISFPFGGYIAAALMSGMSFFLYEVGMGIRYRSELKKNSTLRINLS